jgi:hypothetical protein
MGKTFYITSLAVTKMVATHTQKTMLLEFKKSALKIELALKLMSNARLNFLDLIVTRIMTLLCI